LDQYSEGKEPIVVTGTILRETDAAILLDVNRDEPAIWLPKSQVEYYGDVGEEVDVEVADWLAFEKGLI